MLILPLLLLTAAGTTTASAQSPVASWELDSFIGSSLKGYGHTPLGIVGAANTRDGTVAVVGRHGELATVHQSMMVKEGMKLRAPALTRGDIVRASSLGRSREPFTAGTIIIEELEVE
jgi:hypothetical protein